jgi:2-dehydro-3-deoxygalactonokinase
MGMRAASFIGGDWGTSRLRLFLCDSQLTVLERREGPGASRACGKFENILNSLVGDWNDRYGELPVILSGMVGSSQGWVQTPYVPCPAQPEQIAAACIELRGGRIHIVPGLSCRNPLGSPDFMRGEETQLLGALQLDSALGHGRHILCLPGTHTKWVVLQDGVVQDFFTAPTGEIFASLCSSGTTLVPADVNVASEVNANAFTDGLARILQSPEIQLLHVVFECRSRRLGGELAPENAASYLSGILIGSDARGALRVLSPSETTRVHIAGTSQLTKLYSMAITALGSEVRALDELAVSVAGLGRINQLVAPH